MSPEGHMLYAENGKGTSITDAYKEELGTHSRSIASKNNKRKPDALIISILGLRICFLAKRLVSG